MLAISQSGTTFHYMNWIPSESGPLVTHYGSIDKDLENPDKIDDHYLDVFESTSLWVEAHRWEELLKFLSKVKKHLAGLPQSLVAQMPL